ncbi:hypothetical protein PF672P2_00079 [Parabacteroides phage PF672P2]|nr:hypothetical protein PF672P2_00079 [Parabacteroides phage PF672P2]
MKQVASFIGLVVFAIGVLVSPSWLSTLCFVVGIVFIFPYVFNEGFLAGKNFECKCSNHADFEEKVINNGCVSKAKKPHTCSLCGEVINKGDSYRWIAVRKGQEIKTIKMHDHCHEFAAFEDLCKDDLSDVPDKDEFLDRLERETKEICRVNKTPIPKSSFDKVNAIFGFYK